MNEQDIKILISAYIDNEVTMEERQYVENLFKKSMEWKNYYNELKNISSTLKKWPDQNLSPDVESKIQHELFPGTKERIMRPRNRILKYVLPTVLMVLLVSTVTLRMVNQAVQPEYVPEQSKEVIAKKLKSQKGSLQPVGEEQYRLASDADARRERALKEGERKFDNLSQISRDDQNKDLEMAKAPSVPASVGQKLSNEISDKKQIAFLGGVMSKTMPLEEKGKVARTIGDEFHPGNTNTIMPLAGLNSPMLNSEPELPYPAYQPAKQGWNTEGYDYMPENEFLTSIENPLSTFSIDVDTASYSNVRRFLTANQMPPRDAVRIEEMINYFDYEYSTPKGEHPFSITTEAHSCPWNPAHQLALIGIKGKTIASEKLPPSNLVFLIDVSGSMADQNKLPLLQSSFRMMVPQLDSSDRVSIVVYAGAAGVVLEPTPGDQHQTILSAIDRLSAGGSTAGGEGIKLAYEMAKKNFIKDGNNRVILATDGDFNVGVSSDGELVRIIEERRNDGIFLTVLGFGMGNYKDAKMEKLADKGNGNYFYIDTDNEARKVLVNELGSTLFTIAKDVKIQVEFNPSVVKAYRLIGYENRILAKEDFNDDTKDAGEIGAGHTVIALYEIVPANSAETFGKVDELKYQERQSKNNDELLTVKFRYKEPDGNTSKLITETIKKNEITENLTDNFRLASSVAEFGLLLRDSKLKDQSSYDHALAEIQKTLTKDNFGYRAELIKLIEKARSINPYPATKKMQK